MRSQRSSPPRALSTRLPWLLYEHVSDRGMYLATRCGVVELHPVEEGQLDEVWRLYVAGLPALDFYRRARGTGSFLAAGWGGLKVELHPEDHGAWRPFVAPRKAGQIRDQLMPTRRTAPTMPPDPPPRPGLNAAALANVGAWFRFCSPDERAELELFDSNPGEPRR